MINAIGNAILTSRIIGEASGVITNGLKMWLPFRASERGDNKQTSPDNTSNNNDATLYSGRVLHLNTDAAKVNSIIFQNPKSQVANADATFAMWLNFDDITSAQTIFDSRSSTNSERTALELRADGHFKIINDDGSTSNDVSFLSYTPTLNQWVFIVVTFSGSTVKLYADGALEGTETLTNGIQMSNVGIRRLGDNAAGTSQPYKGYISYFQLWQQEWGASDVSYSYNNINNAVVDNSSSPLNLNNLLHYMPLNEGDGQFLVDVTSTVTIETYGLLSTSGQTVTDIWEVGKTLVPQLGMQDITIGSNLLTDTYDYTSDWSTLSASITTGASDSPSGFYDSVGVKKTANSSVSVIKQSYTTTSADTYCVSIYLHDTATLPANAISTLAVRNTGARALHMVNFDWATTTASVATGSAAVGNISVVDKGSGWYRLSFTVVLPSGAACDIEFKPDGSNSTSTINDEVLIFGFQFEISSNLPSDFKFTANGASIASNSMTYNSTLKTPSVDVISTPVRSREMSFNADTRSWAQVKDDSTLDFGTGAYTMECWAKFKYVEQGGAISYNVICTLGGNGVAALTSSIGVMKSIGGTSTYFKAFIGSSQVDASSTSFSKGDWYHVAATRDDSGNVKFYINATLKDTATNTNNVSNSDDPQIGRDSTSDRYYGDLISDVRYYNIALTQEQIQQNYDAGTAAHSN